MIIAFKRCTVAGCAGVCAAALCLFLIVYSYPHYFQTAYCTIVEPFTARETGLSRLFPCSNIRQSIIGKVNVVENQADVPGWTFYTPDNKDEPAYIQIQLTKDRSSVIFYPRASGHNSTVQVWEKDNFVLLNNFSGDDKSWSPIGSQKTVCLDCLTHGYGKEYTARLTIELKGPWAQLWSKDNNVLF